MEGRIGVSALQPLTEGVIVLVGIKASNLDDGIREHPRVVLWESQRQDWTSKPLPQNTRAIFFTRFVGHASFARIQKEARKRHITLFNPSGTGEVVRQVRELLSLQRPVEVEAQAVEEETTPMRIEQAVQPETPVPIKGEGNKGKLDPLRELIDPSLSGIANAKRLIVKAQELGIQTTEASLAQMVVSTRRKTRTPAPVKVKVKEKDVTLEMFDTLIKDLQDMRQFVADTVKENTKLKAKLDRFKRFIEE